LTSVRVAVPRVGLAVLGVAVAVTAGFESVAEPSRNLVFIFAPLAGVALLVLALTRFEAFVLVVLAIRASVDWTKAPTEVGEPIRSGALTTGLALLFLGLAVAWLLVQFKAGRFVPLPPLSLAWLAFLGAALLSSIASDLPLASLAETGRIATAVAMLVVLQQMFGDGYPVRPVLTACYVSAIVPLLVAASQAVAAGGSVAEGGLRVYGTFVHPNALGFYLVILTVMGVALLPHVSRTVRPPLLVVLWGSTIVIIMTYSRGSWIALTVGLIVVAVLQAPRFVFLIIGVAIVLALIVPPITTRLTDLETGSDVSGVRGNSLQWRFDYWSTIITLADHSTIIGIGPKMTQYVTDEAKVPHNDYLRAYVEMGVLGLTMYAAVVLALISTVKRALRHARPGFDQGIAIGFAGCVVAFLIYSLAENVMSQVVVLWYFFVFAAAATTVSRSTSPTPQHAPVDVGDRDGRLPPPSPPQDSTRTVG
jgi:putative inorganic carbon (HCO3(-)) transporter